MLIDDRERPRTMTPDALRDIDALAAPSQDGGVLVWPRGVSLVQLAQANRERLCAARFEVCGRPAQEIRPIRADEPLTFMTGHQPALFHAGVWAKNAAVSRLASLCRGRAVFLAVDSDVPGRLSLEWPDDSGAYCRTGRAAVRSIRDWQSYETIDAEAAEAFAQAIQAAPDRIHPDKATILDDFRGSFAASDGDYVSRWCHAMRSVGAGSISSGMEYNRVSDWFDWNGRAEELTVLQRASAALVAHLICNAERFARVYNGALERYRSRRGIRGRQHPIPDLRIDDGRIELPLWRVGPDHARRRVWIDRTQADEIRLTAENEVLCRWKRADVNPFECLSQLYELPGIRPRALAQTMFARLFACDLFVHGLGGAKYDTITDEIIRTFFNIEPPAYACVSATLLLPTRRHGITHAQLLDARRKARDVHYNPQRYLSADAIRSAAKLTARRAHAIDESDELRRSHSTDRNRRRDAYQAIRQTNTELLKLDALLADRLADDAAELERLSASDRLALSREWFFALHEAERLKKLERAVVREIN